LLENHGRCRSVFAATADCWRDEPDRCHSPYVGVARAKNEIYIVADPAPLTLSEIVTALRAGEGRRAGLLPVPPALIALASSALGRTEEWQRLGGTLVADPGKLIRAGWKPATDTRDGLAALAAASSPRNAMMSLWAGADINRVGTVCSDRTKPAGGRGRGFIFARTLIVG
jgi:hypothetical protein